LVDLFGFSDDPDKQYEAEVPDNYDSLYIPPSKLDRDGDGNFRFIFYVI